MAILWDSKTLKAMDATIIEHSEVEGLDWSAMYLWADEVSLAEPQDTPHDREKVVRDLAKRFAWAHLGEQWQRIKSMLEWLEIEDDLAAFKACEHHLRLQLEFRIYLNTWGRGSLGLCLGERR